jgi:hypothetical protein
VAGEDMGKESRDESRGLAEDVESSDWWRVAGEDMGKKRRSDG